MSFRSKFLKTDTLARDPAVCCVLDSSFQFLYCNRAWDDFARANGGTSAVRGQALIQKRLLQYIPDILRPFFWTRLNILLAGGSVWSHQYECSSAKRFRIYELQALRLPDENEILMCHTPIITRPHTRIAIKPTSRSTDEQPARICCHCRHTQREDGSGIWDWIPDYIASPPGRQIADLCPTCADYYQKGGEFYLDVVK